MKCVSIVSYSVCLNGRPYFRPFRGLRQKYPFKSILFLIYNKRLFSLLRLVRREGRIRVKASKCGPVISHLLFTYYCILFGEASPQSVSSMKNILREYEIHLG